MSTTTTTASTELRKLQATRDRAHGEFLEWKAKLQAWDLAGLDPGIPVGSAQADLHAARREQKRGPNPHRDRFEAARAAYHERDLALQAFKREHVRDRLAELDPDAEAAIEALRESFEAQLEASGRYRAVVDQVHAIVGDTPGLARTQNMDGYDPRVQDWATRAREALDSEIARPGLTPAAEAKLDV